jgi:hypothetical protein
MKKHKKNKGKQGVPSMLTRYNPEVLERVRDPKGVTQRMLAKRPHLRRKKPEQALEQAIQTIPRITNETVAEHREEVLSSARKYIYPLKHSTHKIVTISVSLFIAVLILFFSYCMLALYRFQSTSGFIYGVTQVIPFPVARAGNHFISYESYLFEVRHYIHYYQTQQEVDFKSTSGKRQLDQYRTQALDEVIDDAYVKQLAQQYGVTISDEEVNNEVTLLQQQNRLGSNNQVFAAVLKEFWGWSINDFKRELKQQLLTEKVDSKLDVAAHERAQNVLTQLQHGGNFSALAKQYSDDPSTSVNGGAYGFEIDRSNRDVPPQVVNVLFGMKLNQISGIINTGDGLEIVQVTAINGDQLQASNIFIAFNSINTYINPIRAKEQPHVYIHVQ